MVDNRFATFHILIIALIVFMYVGCGFKANPIYDPNKKSIL